MPSSIEWTDETWNPVTGCTRVSPGCDHCYMFALYPRLKGMSVNGYETGPDDVRLLPERLQAPLTWKKPRRVFVNSMSDVFHPSVPFAFVLEMFKVMQEASSQHGHIFQVLTKRPGRAVGWWKEHEQHFSDGWPGNIWIGTSVESQKYASRLTVLGRLPAPIRFVSAEPLLERLDLTDWLESGVLQWVIVGGESGARARPMNLDWAQELRDQSVRANVAFFLKQLGGVRNKRSGEDALLDGQLWQQYPKKKENKTMPSNSTTWQLEDHTLGKHRVLRNYMDAWLPIMRSRSGRVLFIDGFAGPGEYAGGEYGSPVIALESLVDHPAKERMKGEIFFLFIEKELDRKLNLEKVIKPYSDKLPVNCYTRVFHATFLEKMTEFLDWFDIRHRKLPPAFVMIDPFGVSDIPMHLLRRILASPSTEVYISFMYDAINRFRSHANFERHLDGLFGCPDWRDGLEIPEGTERKNFFYALYEESLRNSGANFVLFFELYKNERLIYTIFFATQRLEGCDVMKKAMWKTAPFGDFKFMSGTANQLTLGIEPIDFTPLRVALHTEFGQKDWVDIEDVEKFVMSDKTGFHTSHLKTKTLRPMERDREIEVMLGTRKNKGTFPKGTILKFLSP